MRGPVVPVVEGNNMEHSIFTTVPVNNEIELCEVNDPECKQLIERQFLKNRISYFIRWPNSSIFRNKRNTCIFCVNDISRDLAEDVVRGICDEYGFHVKFLMKRTDTLRY